MLALVTAVACVVCYADPVIQKFEYWGGATDSDKVHIYIGWTNGGWRIRHDASCRDVCAPWDRAAQRADVPLFGVCASQGRIHPGKERLDVCATRALIFPRDPLENPTPVMCPFLGGAKKSLLFFLDVKLPNH
jgi:hypothetical protein